MLRLFKIAFLFTVFCGASADASETFPSFSELEKEQQRIEETRKGMFDPENPALKDVVSVFPNIPDPEPSHVDVEAIARSYTHEKGPPQQEELFAFVSFTMPQHSLLRFIRQVHRVGGTVVLNGFKNDSLKETAAAIRDLGEHSGEVQINPKAFTMYQVEAIPTVVLTVREPGSPLEEDGCAAASAYVAITGDVSLDYALEEIARREPHFEQLALRYLQQFRGI